MGSARAGAAALTAVGMLGAPGVAPARPAADGASAPPSCTLEHRRFHTLPGLRPSGLCMSRQAWPRSTATGRILLSPRPRASAGDAAQYGPMIVSDRGQILWFLPRPRRVHDVKVVTYRGRPHIAFYMYRKEFGGDYWIYDERYRPVARVAAAGGIKTNMHDLQLTDRGTAYLMAYDDVDVPGVGLVTDFAMQEVDIATGDLVWEWRSSQHIPLSASYVRRTPGRPAWDYFHGNSIELPERPDGTIIVSARKTSAIYGISRRTGEVEWILGGKQDQFGLAERHPGWRFCAQHDARRMPNGDVLVFDNGGAGMGNRRDCPVHPARVLRFRVQGRKRKVQLVRTIRSESSSADGKPYFPKALGSARRLPNGDVLV